MPSTVSKIDDPAWRSARASKAGRISQSTDNLIKRIANRAPELTPVQRERLALLLDPDHARAAS